MKKFIIAILLLIPTLSFASNIATLKEDCSIILPALKFQEEVYNWKVTFDYIGEKDGQMYWVLSDIIIKDEDPDVQVPDEIDDYGFESNKFVSGINEARRNGSPCNSGGVGDIKWDDELAKAALDHSIDMAMNNFFDHTGSEGSNFWDRVGNTDFKGRPIGENIGAGYRSVEDAINGWLHSPGHCKNIMNGSVTHMGYAFVVKKGTNWTYYHTMVTGNK